MAVNKGEIGIYGVLRRDGGNNILAKTDQIQDANTNKTQAEVNQEAFVLSSRINDISTRVSDLELKTGKVINYKGSVRDKTALDALYPKFGDVYKVESTIIIDNKKYPADTKFIHIGTNQNGEKAWEPLGGIALSQSNEALFIDDTGIGLRLGSGFKEPGGVLLLDLGSGLTCEQMGLTIATGGGLQLSYDGKLYVDTGEGLNIEHGNLSISCGSCLKFTDGHKVNIKLSNRSGISESWDGLKISTGNCIDIDYDNNLCVKTGKGLITNNQELEVRVSTNNSGLYFNDGMLSISTGSIRVDSGNRIKILYGDGLKIGDDYKLRLNLVSSPLYMDDYEHISIRCGSGLRITTEYISDYNYNPELCVNYGNTLEMSDDHFLNVNISTSTTNNDVAIGLIQSDTQGLYISSSKLEQFIKQVMATS